MNQPNGLMTTSIIVGGDRLLLSEIEQVFGVASTSTWKAKPEVIEKVPDINCEEWRFELPATHFLSFSDAVDFLLSKFSSKPNEIASYCAKHHLKTSLHLRLNGIDSDFVLAFDRPETVQSIAQLEASIYIHTEDLRCLHAYE